MKYIIYCHTMNEDIAGPYAFPSAVEQQM